MKKLSSFQEDLRKWFSNTDPKGDWKRINSKGEAIGPCAREPGEPKPKCMSKGQRASLSKKERASAVRRKREQDPNPERQGEPINVTSKVNENMEQLNEKNKPTNPELWSRAIAQAKSKFDVYPSAYANGWASKWYKEHGGGWKSVSEAAEVGDDPINQGTQDGVMKKGSKTVVNKTIDNMKEDAPPIHVRSLYAQTYAKHGKTASQSKAAQELAYRAVEKKHGPEMRKNLSDYHNKNQNESVEMNEVKDEEEYGYEGDMAMNQLQTIIRHSEYLMDMMKPDTDLPEWVQSKITLATDYIQTACDYMTSEMDEAVNAAQQAAIAINMKKKGIKPENEEVNEATSAAARLQKAFQRAKEQREREERAGEALLKPKPPMQKEESNSKDVLQGGLRKNLKLQVTKSGKIPKTIQNAMKKKIAGEYSNRDTAGPKGRLPEEIEYIDEGRPSQRHPLEGHEYHKKSNAELEYIAKDAHKAAEAMKSHNTTAENKYRDQANDSATVRHFRKTSGMPDWYKKKYGHVNEAAVVKTNKAPDNRPPFDPPYRIVPSTITDKSGAKHDPMSRAKNLAKQAATKQAGKVHEEKEKSRKSQIIKDIVKNKDKFEKNPIVTDTTVKTDNLQ